MGQTISYFQKLKDEAKIYLQNKGMEVSRVISIDPFFYNKVEIAYLDSNGFSKVYKVDCDSYTFLTEELTCTQNG